MCSLIRKLKDEQLLGQVGDDPTLPEGVVCIGHRFRQLLWDIVDGEASARLGKTQVEAVSAPGRLDS